MAEVLNQTPLTKPKEKYWLAFFIAMACACAIFIPYIILIQGYFLFFGDFNVQQVPFYKLAHQAVTSGNVSWSFGTDLGTNFIGSYTFYLLGSPFFWLTLPFPNDFVPHLMGPLLILKFSFASLTAYAFLTRFIKNKNFALMGALAYAFSGFSVYNIFFNHFHEAIIYFPLLLLGLEMLVKDKRRGVFAFVVFLAALSNYYFFFGMVIFTVLYFIFRTLSGAWKITWKTLLAIIIEAIVGVLMSAVLLLPSVLMVLSNNRVGSYLTGWPGLLYDKYQRYGYIFQCFFFPPDLPARPVFFPDADAKWSSVAGWMPLFSMTGVVTYFFAKKGTWLKRLLICCIIFAFIPILNASFSAFNYAYYARWFYMPILMMALATARCLEDKSVNWKKGWIWTFAVTVIITLAIGFYPHAQYSDGTFSGFGLYSEKYADRFWITCGISLLSLAIFGLLLLLKKKSLRKFTVCGILAICLISVPYSSYFIYTGKQSSYSANDFIVPNLLENYDTIELEGVPLKQNYNQRIDVYKGMDNIGMFLQTSSINAFHSVVTRSIFDYYDFIGVERVVGSRPEADEKNYALRSLLSVKYMFDYTEDNNHFADDNGNTKMTGYKYVNTQDGFDIYENEYYIPYGFTYDYYVTESFCDKLSEEERQHIMLEAMVIPDDQVDKYSGILKDIRTKIFDDDYYVRKATTIISANENKESSLQDSSAASSAVSDSSIVTSSAVTSTTSQVTSGESTVASDSSVSSVNEAAELVGEALEEKLNQYKYSFNIRSYRKACTERAKTACLTFETNNKGFTALAKQDSDNYVFFSVPYDEGWTATIDGQPVDIEKVNVGFMAVLVEGDGQTHTISFTYNTPGLKYGIIISIVAVLFWLIYSIIGVLTKKKRLAADVVTTVADSTIEPVQNDTTPTQQAVSDSGGLFKRVDNSSPQNSVSVNTEQEKPLINEPESNFEVDDDWTIPEIKGQTTQAQPETDQPTAEKTIEIRPTSYIDEFEKQKNDNIDNGEEQK